MIQYCYDDLSVPELEEVWGLLQRTPVFTAQWTLLTFLARLREGYVQLWVEPNLDTPEAVLVTEIVGHGEEKTIMVLAFAGKNPDKVDNGTRFESIKRWAFKNGGMRIQAICGDKQVRLFARLGFVKTANVITLELKDETQCLQ